MAEVLRGEVVPAPRHREIGAEEAAELAEAAHSCRDWIVRDLADMNGSAWRLAEHFYEFKEEGYHRVLGYETLEEFLAEPEIGIKRSTFFHLARMWRDLVVVRQVSPARLAELDPSKVQEVCPAIMRGDVEVEKAFSDARTLARRDLRELYRRGPDAPLDAGEEPERAQCPRCGSWVDADQLEEE